MGEMKRAMAREEQDRIVREVQERTMQIRFASTVVIAAIIAAVRLALEDIDKPTPQFISVVSDSVQLVCSFHRPGQQDSYRPVALTRLATMRHAPFYIGATSQPMS
jgi:hypothetical protein